MVLKGAGFYELKGLAWSGKGHIEHVDISTDGGKQWQKAQLQQPVLSKSLTRFRQSWHWDGNPTTVMSRATDSTGETQTSHTELVAARGSNHYHHYNAIIAWQVGADGRIENVYS